MRFKYGCRDGVPIMLGYLTVSFTFGVSCVAKGFAWWMPLLCSFTNFTGTGQFAGMDLIAAGGSVVELIATMLVINARYSLMGISLSQKLEGKTTLLQRLVIAFGLTDENYAVAIRQPRDVSFEYFLGVSLTSFSGWVAGTLAIFTVVLTAIAMSCLFYYVPVLNGLSSGWSIIICGIVSALIGAIFFPIKQDGDSENKPKDGVIFGSKKSDEYPEETYTGRENVAGDANNDAKGGAL